MKEIWKDIEGYEGYKVSNYGRVIGMSGVVLKQMTKNNGYKQVTICNNIHRKSALVHRLVAKAFIENPKNYPQINHKDCDKTNNNANNLEWCNASHNQKHSIKNGLREVLKGEKSGTNKLTRNDVLQIRSVYEQGFAKQYEIAEAYGVSKSTIQCVISRRNWSHI